MDAALTAAAIGVGGTVIVGIAGFWANVRNTNKLAGLTEQGQLTDRYTKAIEQLGSDKLDVRIGGIYALERVARDSVSYHPTVMEVLAAFIRERSHEPWPDPERTPPDLQASLTVIVRRDATHDWHPANLAGAILIWADATRVPRADIGGDLTGVNLMGADLTLANLSDADLSPWVRTKRIGDRTHTSTSPANLNSTNFTRAVLPRANLARTRLNNAILVGAILTGADLTGADLTFANLTDADLSPSPSTETFSGRKTTISRVVHTGTKLSGANLTRALLVHADLTDADLTDATLTGATLTGANLTGAKLTDAKLIGANLTGAKLINADLTRANLESWDVTGAVLTANLTGADLTGANLTGARWPADAEVPEGWQRDADSEQLSKAAGSGPAAPTTSD